jgi:hypothetical protein
MTVIDVRRAELRTATVTIETIRVDGRQVTLSTFRQLQSEPVAGPMWGWVNYHPDRCADDLEHRHVVWQKDETLLRATVLRPTEHMLGLDSWQRHRVFVAALLDGKRWSVARQSDPIALEVAPAVWIKSTFLFPLRPDALWRLNKGEWVGEGEKASIREHYGMPNESALEAFSCMAAESLKNQRAKYDVLSLTWSAVLELPQLFIAT